MKLILMWQCGSDGYTFGDSLTVVPIEYESEESWLLDFEKVFDKMLEDWNNPTYPRVVYEIPGFAKKTESGIFRWRNEGIGIFKTFEEFIQSNNLQILRLEDWFEDNKGTLMN